MISSTSESTSPSSFFNYSTILSAYSAINSYIIKTPLLESPSMNTEYKNRILLKAENLQYTNTFKFRGALHKLLLLTLEQKNNGIVAFSSGNHAQGVAYACNILNIKSYIIMPIDAPKIKIQKTKEYGANVIFYDRLKDDRELIAKELCIKENLTLIPPYDDYDIMAGQGTIGVEIAQELNNVDICLCPHSGGGLTSGVFTWMKYSYPNCECIPVEPYGYNDFQLSLQSGMRVPYDTNYVSICDSLMAKTPGILTWEVNSKIVKRSMAIEDEETLHAMYFAMKEFKILLEPGGAIALAAALKLIKDEKLIGKTIVVIASGGNVDLDEEKFKSFLNI